MTESDVAVLVERIDNLQKQVSSGQERSEKWREHFDSKLDKRPCEEHGGFFHSINKQLSFLWWIISVSLVGILSLSVAWGALNNQVNVNTSRWERYFQSHPDMK